MRILIAALLLTFPLAPAAETFRGLPWGADAAEVIERNGPPTREVGDCLVYFGIIAEREATILYCVGEQGLYRGAYVFRPQHGINHQRYVDDYARLQQLLEERYGEPSRHEVAWRDPRLSGPPAHWGFRIAQGELALRTEWQTADKHIFMVMEKVADGRGFVSHYLGYEDPEVAAARRALEWEL